MEVDEPRTVLRDRASGCHSLGSNHYPSGQLRKISIGIEASPKIRPRSRKEDESVLPAKEKRDRASGCHSLGSNHYPSGQLRKISIGIVASPKIRPRSRKEDESVLPAKEKRVSSSQGKSSGKCDVGLKAALNGKQAEVPDEETAAWASTRSFHQETATEKKGQFYTNRSSLESGEGMQKKFDCIGRKREKGGDAEKVEEFAFTTMLETHASDKEECGEKLEKSAKGGSEALRVKLWEILGAAPSQNDPNSNSRAQKKETKNLKSQSNGERRGEGVRPNQNSDPIETDSESHNQTKRRPVTRSLTRKKAPTKPQPKLQHVVNNDGNFLLSSRSRFKQKHQVKNIFAFDEAEARAGSFSWPLNGNSSLSKRKESKKKITKAEEDRVCFPRKAVSDSLKMTEREKPPSTTTKKTAPKSKKMEGFGKSTSQKKRDPLKPKNLCLDEEYHHLPSRKKTDPQEDLNSPPKNADQQKSFSSSPVQKNTNSPRYVNSPSPKNAQLQENFGSPLPTDTDTQADFQSPTFAMDTPIQNDFSSPPLPKSTPVEEAFNGPTPTQREFMAEGFHSIRTMKTSRLCSSGSDTHTESSDDTRESKKPPTEELSPDTKERDAAKRLSPSSIEEQDSEDLEEEKLIYKGFRTREKWPSGTYSPEEPSFTLHRIKRLRSQDDMNRSDLHPMSPSPKGTEESNVCQGTSEQDQEDGLARAIAQFALVLERFKNKMKSQTGKKSSEVLASVADRIHLQLQSIESQIQTDVGKFTSLGKSKRKRLESRFQEEQERLKLIHDKFKEEVNQHLQHCRSAIEELEAYQRELKGNAERQKASHRKLLLQAEEAIRIQLSDAERSIAAIHKASRQKMQGLKHVLMECLSECAY